MKKAIVLLLLLMFGLNFSIAPALAIKENVKPKKQKETEQINIFDTINFEKWKQKNDPNLEKYILKAVENNFDIKIAALQTEEAKQKVTLTRAGQLPTFSIGASPALSKLPASTSSEGSISLPMFASYELDLFGKNWDKTKASKKLYKAAIYDEQTADIAIVSMVAAAYYNIVNLDEIIEIQEKLTKNREEIFKLNKIANQEGLVSMSDLSLSEKSYILAQNDLIEYRKARQNALNALAVLTGDSANNTENYRRADFSSLSDNFNIPNEINTEVIVNRPDYKSIEEKLEAQGLNIRAARKEFLPSFNILGLLSFAATSAMGSMNFENALALIGASANWSLFTGFKRTANLKLNKNKYEQLLQQYQKTNLTAIQEINDSLYNFKSDNEKFVNNKKAYDIQKNDYKLWQSKYNNGVISKLNLLQQEETLLFTQKLLTQSKTDCFIDEISLYKTTGAKI